MSNSLSSLKGVIQGTTVGLTKEDTRSLDYGSHGGPKVRNGLISGSEAYTKRPANVSCFNRSAERLILDPRIFILGALKSETTSRESHTSQNLRVTFGRSGYWGLSCSVGVCDEYSAEGIKVMLFSAQEVVDGRQRQ